MKSSKSFLISIFLTAFLDMLGIGIIIPVLPAVFYSKDALHFYHVQSATEIRWAYCLLMASYSFMLFFGAPILGTLSDRFGRKKIIQISLIGTAVGYALFSFALNLESITLLYLSRIIPGFFAGSLSVLFSAISDVSSPEDKPKNFALVGIAFGTGFVLGPAIGGILSDKTILSWFNLTTPFIFATCLAILNFLLVHFFFIETSTTFKKSKLTFFKGVENIKKAFSASNLRVLFSISFLSTLGFSFFTQFFSVFMFQKFGCSQKTIGLIFGWVGLWIIFTQGFILRRLVVKYQPSEIVSKTMLFMGLGIIAMAFPNAIWGILVCNVVVAISQGLNSPNLLSLVSKQAKPEQQGEIMGINQSMQSVGQFIPPLIVAIFGENLTSFPIIIAGIFIVIAWMVFILFYHNKPVHDQAIH